MGNRHRTGSRLLCSNSGEIFLALRPHLAQETQRPSLRGCQFQLPARILPVLTRGAVERAEVSPCGTVHVCPQRIVFSGKDYFYPDLPRKGYQISQFDPALSSPLIRLFRFLQRPQGKLA